MNRTQALTDPSSYPNQLHGTPCRYLDLIQELLSSVQQMEDALKKRKQRAKGSTAGLAAGASPAVEGGGGEAVPLSDSEKIQLQLLLDVAAFEQEMGGAGGAWTEMGVGQRAGWADRTTGRTSSDSLTSHRLPITCGQTGMADPLRDCAPYAQLLRAVGPARLLLRRPDVYATLPPAIDAFLSS